MLVVVVVVIVVMWLICVTVAAKYVDFKLRAGNKVCMSWAWICSCFSLLIAVTYWFLPSQRQMSPPHSRDLHCAVTDVIVHGSSHGLLIDMIVFHPSWPRSFPAVTHVSRWWSPTKTAAVLQKSCTCDGCWLHSQWRGDTSIDPGAVIDVVDVVSGIHRRRTGATARQDHGLV